MWKTAILIFGLLASSSGHAKSLQQAAIPIGDTRSWASKNDYPSRALREKIGGTTSFRLTIGADGSISGCEITVSSGHTILDQATCRFLQKRARFTPAKDKYGKATIGKYEGYYQWVPWEPKAIHEDWGQLRLPFEMIDLQRLPVP